jgi:hypothetical protein
MALTEDSDQGSYRRPHEEDVDELDDDVQSDDYGTMPPAVQYPSIPRTDGRRDSVSEFDCVQRTKKTIRGGGGTAHDVWHFFDKHTRACGLCQ